MNFKKKRIKIAFIFLFFLLAFYGHNAQANSLRIAIVKDKNVKAQNLAIDAFRHRVHDNHSQDISFVEYDIENREFSVFEIKSQGYDLICSVGSKATNMLGKEIKDTPIVFTLVLDPVRYNVVKSLSASGTNITGVALDISAKEQLRLLKTIIPNVQRVGIIHGPRTSLFVGDAISAQEGLGVAIVPASVYASNEVSGVLEKLSEKIDVLLMASDTTVCSREFIAYILIFGLKNKIPIFTFSPNLVKAGAIASYSYDFRDLGEQTGDIALNILGGKNPAAIPIVFPRKKGYAINQRIADFLGIKLSSSLISGADSVIE